MIFFRESGHTLLNIKDTAKEISIMIENLMSDLLNNSDNDDLPINPS